MMPYTDRRAPGSTDTRALRALGGESHYHFWDSESSSVPEVSVPATPRSSYYISIDSSSKGIVTTVQSKGVGSDYFGTSRLNPAPLEMASVGQPADTATISSPEPQMDDVELSRYLEKIYNLEAGRQHRAASKLVFLYVERKFAAGDMLAVNRFMAIVEMSRLSAWSISGLLRSTARARRHLPAWPHCLAIGRRVLTGKVNSVDALFAGLQE